MSPVYPLYVIERDDLSVRRVAEASSMDWIEKIDVEDGLYFAWDSVGKRFEVTWDSISKRPSLSLICNGDVECISLFLSIYQVRYTPSRKSRPGECTPVELERLVAQLKRARE